MGHSSSKNKITDTSKKIDRGLKKDADVNSQIKLLILGAGESGKSTILKQVKLIYGIPFKPFELTTIRQTIQFNCMESMHMLCDQIQPNLSEIDSKTRKLVKSFMAISENTRNLTSETAQLIEKLWKRSVVREVWSERATYWHLDAAPYYFENAWRFSEPQFEPTDDDIVMARVRTTGIVTTEFVERGRPYSIIDVGGQRNERRKWIHCFDDVESVLFVVSLIGYNQVMFEDSHKLRIIEALTLFEQIVSNPSFSRAAFVIALNKKDLFEQMLRTCPLSTCFPQFRATEEKYANDHTSLLRSALEFIQKQFEDAYHRQTLTPANRRSIVTHVIAARYRKDVKYMVEDMHAQLAEQRPDIKTRMSIAKAVEDFGKPRDHKSTSSRVLTSDEGDSTTNVLSSQSSPQSGNAMTRSISSASTTDSAAVVDKKKSPPKDRSTRHTSRVKKGGAASADDTDETLSSQLRHVGEADVTVPRRKTSYVDITICYLLMHHHHHHHHRRHHMLTPLPLLPS